MLNRAWEVNWLPMWCQRNVYKASVHTEASEMAGEAWRNLVLHKLWIRYSGACSHNFSEISTSSSGMASQLSLLGCPASLFFLPCVIIFLSNPLILTVSFSLLCVSLAQQIAAMELSSHIYRAFHCCHISVFHGYVWQKEYANPNFPLSGIFVKISKIRIAPIPKQYWTLLHTRRPPLVPVSKIFAFQLSLWLMLQPLPLCTERGTFPWKLNHDAAKKCHMSY